MTYIFPKRKLNIPTIRYYPYKLTYVPIKGDKCTHTERQSNQSTDEMIAIKILPPAEGLSCFTFLRKVFSPKKQIFGLTKQVFCPRKQVFGLTKLVFGWTKQVFGLTKQVFSPRQQEFGPKTGFGIKTGPRTHFFGQGHKRRSNLGKPHPKKKTM